nr:hypothetical protein [Corynebacterium lactis]
MATEENITSTNTAPSTGADGKPRRRRAAHRVVRATAAGQHTACGEFLPAATVRPVDVDATGTPYKIEFYKCTACARIDALETELDAHRPLALLSATHRLAFREEQEQ